MPRFRINEIINGKRGDHGRDSRSVEQGASAKFWINLQTAVGLFDAEKKLAGEANMVRCLLQDSEFITDM
ncbi:hypothetical protein [Bradyrhizobium sp. CCBAU 53421]|uniref:hypothetical protein n=1 Tax=Bradyrhizobium sp. CCBAU 53421 TaxID=1325120 RepID=UPI00188AE70A|nr:hypothetical protein [Bradyrhizobium sp. CCBAU 53421]